MCSSAVTFLPRGRLRPALCADHELPPVPGRQLLVIARPVTSHRQREPRTLSTSVIASPAPHPPSSRGDRQVAVAIQEVDWPCLRANVGSPTSWIASGCALAMTGDSWMGPNGRGDDVALKPRVDPVVTCHTNRFFHAFTPTALDGHQDTRRGRHPRDHRVRYAAWQATHVALTLLRADSVFAPSPVWATLPSSVAASCIASPMACIDAGMKRPGP